MGPRPSSGCPRPSTMRPRNASPTPTTGCSRTSSTWLPGDTPARSPSGMSSTRPVRKPTTSAKIPPLSRVEMRQSEPTGAPGPLASTTSPITSVTRPLTRTASSSPSRRRARGQLLLDDLPRHAERQLEQLALVAVAQPPAEGGELLEGLDERLGDRRELARHLLAAEVVARLEGAAELVARLAGRRGHDGL